MKNILITTAAFILIGSSLASCSKLDENPKTSIASTTFYKTQSDAVAAVTAAYSTLSTDINADFPIYGRNLNLIIDNTSDNQVYSPSNTNPDVRALGTATYISSNDRVHKIYAQLYWGIDKANVAIDNIPNIPSSQFVDITHPAANLIREAKFIRALYYFNLVRLFGPVPLVLHDAGNVNTANTLVSRAPKDSVYAQIISDLTDATNLPGTYSPVTDPADIGRVTAGAAHALLAKVYATRHDWANAETELLKTLTAGTVTGATGTYGYDLFPLFSHIFQTAYKNGIEHIFSAQFKYNGGAVNSQQNLSNGDFSTFTTSTYTGDIPADTTVVNLFAIADQRRNVTFFDSLKNGTKTVKWPYFNFAKYIDSSVSPITSQTLSGVNFPIIRYAEILLLQAETLNELNGGPTADAYTAINIVRARAYGVYSGGGTYSITTHDLTPGLNQADFRDSVYLERRKEFIQESQRWFDLVRRSGQDGLPAGQYYLNAVHGMLGNPKAAATLKDTLFPIPQTEIDLYAGQNPNFYQNPGW
jgi:hypothetical protein